MSSILEPSIKLIKLKEISGCLYKAEANVKAFTIRNDSAYLNNYEICINCLNLNLDTLLRLFPKSKIAGTNIREANQNFSVQIDTLRELIIGRIDLFTEYIKLKAGKQSQDALLQLLQKVKIKKLEAVNLSVNLPDKILEPEVKTVSLTQKPIPSDNHPKDIEPKKSFFARLFSSKKKKKEMPEVLLPVALSVVVPKDLPVVVPVAQSDSIHQNLRKIIAQTMLAEKIKSGRALLNEINIAERENSIMNHLFYLLNKLEEKILVEKIERIDIATKETSKKINFVSNLFIASGVIIALMFLYFIYLDIRRANRFRERLLIASEYATQKAEESTKLKEAFLANMSHEIRTPMNAIIGFSDILSKKNLDVQEKEYVRIIKSAGENLLTIINDILDISKIEAGMMTFEENNFSIKEIFKSLKGMLAEKAKEKNIDLLFICDKNVPEFLLGDPTRLTQIIINLAGNAIKFTEKGSVQVIAKFQESDSDYELTKQDFNEKILLEFSVTDTGIGIPEDKLGHIFERFTQAESQTTRKYGGTGLGLSIAKQLVELQGGSLSVKSEFNAGSVFSFSIPYKKSLQLEAQTEKTEKKYNMEGLRKLNILLVEDNKLNIMLILSLFSENGIKLQVAENGCIAIEKLKENDGVTLLTRRFDIILMDMEMPIMSGYQAATIIRNELKNNIPIIAMTAHAMSDEKERCLSLGMNEYISKPINSSLLFEKMYYLTLT